MRIVGQRPEPASPTFASRWDDFCSSGDAETGAECTAEHALAYKF